MGIKKFQKKGTGPSCFSRNATEADTILRVYVFQIQKDHEMREEKNRSGD